MVLFIKFCLRNIYRFLSEPGYRRFLILILLYSGRKRFLTFPVRFNGKKFLVRDSLSFIWQYWDIYVEEFYFFECKKSKPVIYDIGSNIGMSILYFIKLYPGAVIYGFEPEEKLFEILKHNLSTNNLLAQDIHIHHAAIWTHNEGVLLNASESDSASISTVREISPGSYNVQSLRLNDLLIKEEIIDFLKIDIEGAETEVIKDCGDSLKRVKNLFVEYHSFPGKAQDLDILLGILKDQGFRVQINSPFRYRRPFKKKYLHSFPDMDLQINIFAYRAE